MQKSVLSAVVSVTCFVGGQDEWSEVSIQGAASITITFDDQTRTEANCDWLRFGVSGERVIQHTGSPNALVQIRSG